MSMPITPQAREEAARWFAARRRGVMAIEEQHAYRSWLADKANAEAMAELDEVWSAMDALKGHDADGRGSKLGARATLLAVTCAASFGIAILSLLGDSQFWTALDWTTR
jgi:ferric-dicitrate binding protein FerR (iron transport regulator)